MKKKKEILIKFNRQNILETAKSLFNEKGVKQTTMDDIAKVADCSKSTIYVYFKSKGEIYNNIIFDHMIILKEAMTKVIENKNEGFENRYYKICSSLVDFQEKYPLYYESLLGEISINEEDFILYPILQNIYDIGEEINAIIRVFIQEGIDNNYLKKDIDIVSTGLVLWACICGLISFAYKKEAYINKALLKTKQEFLNYAFRLQINSLLSREVK